jgi:fructose-1,6-bisphosphatase
MRILIISDIHANYTAFETVLKDAQGQWDYVWCLGDVVGYGPDPNDCVEKLRELRTYALRGITTGRRLTVWISVHSTRMRGAPSTGRARR